MSDRDPAWPVDDSGGILGDGRFATRTEHPATAAEIQTAVRRAVAEGLAVYPQGGGTALDYGGVPARPGVAIRLGKLDRVVDYPVADMTITVEAGMTLAAVRALVGRHGQRLAIEASDPDRDTLGGIFAAASTGPRRFGWGRPRDQIIGVAFVTGDGELVRGGGRVVKNVAGYDFPKLLTGSLGTLGIITELTLKVNPRPEASAFVRVPFATMDAAANALDALNVSGTRPVALELLASEASEHLRHGWDLLVGFEGNRAAVAWQVARLGSELCRAELAVLRDDEAERAWLDRAADEATWSDWEKLAGLPWPADFVAAVESQLMLAQQRRFVFRASFAPAAAPRFAAALDRSLWWVAIHAGNGIVRGVSTAGFAAEYEAGAALGRLRAEAERLGGSLILSACPAAWKPRLGVWGPPRPDWALAERVKAALDPGRVLNPGRFVGSI